MQLLSLVGYDVIQEAIWKSKTLNKQYENVAYQPVVYKISVKSLKCFCVIQLIYSHHLIFIKVEFMYSR